VPDNDPMARTNAAFYDMINQEDWDFRYTREQDILDVELDTDEMMFPVVYEYHIPGPMPGVFIKISMSLRDDQQKIDFLQFISNLGEFLNEEDERYG